MTRPQHWSLALAGILAAAWLACGCSQDPSQGYTTASLYPEDVSTVAVPIWKRGSAVYRRDLERRLTEALIKRIELDTPYKVTDKSKADTLLEGTITAVGQRVMSFDPEEGRPRDVEMTILVDFTWTNLRTGEILVNKQKFRASGVYYPTSPLDEDSFLGAEDAINQMARRIVEHMEKPW